MGPYFFYCASSGLLHVVFRRVQRWSGEKTGAGGTIAATVFLLSFTTAAALGSGWLRAVFRRVQRRSGRKTGAGDTK